MKKTNKPYLQLSSVSTVLQLSAQCMKFVLYFTSSAHVFYSKSQLSKIKNRIIINSFLLLFLPVHSVSAEEIIQNKAATDAVFESRIRRLENQLFEKLHESEDTLLDRLVFSGLLEVEAFQTDGPGENFNDINLAAVELALGAKINNTIDAHVLLLHEEGEEQDIVVDEGVIEFHYQRMSLSVGKKYLPFGHFDSFFISDPLTLEMAETNDTAITAGYEIGGFFSSVYVFNGDVAVVGEKEGVKQYGVQLGYAIESEKLVLDVGLGYINNLSESDGLSDYFTAVEVEENIAGVALHVSVGLGHWNVIAEYISATGAYAVNEIGFKGEGAQPSSYNLELGYSFVVSGRDVSIAAGVQGTEESLALGAPEQRLMLGANWAVYQQTHLAVEYMQAEDYAFDDGGTGETTHTLTFQLAVEF